MAEAKTKTNMRVPLGLSKQEQFFYKHAAYSYDPKTETEEHGRVRCARAMARAEQYASDMDWGFCWEYDADGCIGCDCENEDCACSSGANHETFVCVVRDLDGKVLASCGSICSPSNDYTRVMEAELALEAMPDLEALIGMTESAGDVPYASRMVVG